MKIISRVRRLVPMVEHSFDMVSPQASFASITSQARRSRWARCDAQLRLGSASRSNAVVTAQAAADTIDLSMAPTTSGPGAGKSRLNSASRAVAMVCRNKAPASALTCDRPAFAGVHSSRSGGVIAATSASASVTQQPR
jgi:hypothetical protein